MAGFFTKMYFDIMTGHGKGLQGCYFVGIFDFESRVRIHIRLRSEDHFGLC